MMQEDKLTQLQKLFPDSEAQTLEQAGLAIEAIFQLIGEDPNREGLLDTPYRFLKAFAEYTQGYRIDPRAFLETQFAAESQNQDIIVVRDIPFESMCEHHLARFNGVAHIAYLPTDKITGLSKFSRLVTGYSRRLQVQERLTTQIADAIFEVLHPLSCAVIIEAEHTCMSARGALAHGAMTKTFATRGEAMGLLEYLK